MQVFFDEKSENSYELISSGHRVIISNIGLPEN